MVERTVRASGHKFWGCSKFPNCRGTRDLKIEIDTDGPGFTAKDANQSGQSPSPSVAVSQGKTPLTPDQELALKTLRDRLLNLSSRNRSIKLNRLDAKWCFDLSQLNEFDLELPNQILEHCLGSNEAIPLLPKPSEKNQEKHQKLDRNLTYLSRSITEIKNEKGMEDLYIGFPFLRGMPKGSDTAIQAPIFLLPVKIEKVTPKKGAPTWQIRANKDAPAFFNKTLFYALSKFLGVQMNLELFEEEIPDELYGDVTLIQKTVSILQQYGVVCGAHPESGDRVLDAVRPFTSKDVPTEFVDGELQVCQHVVVGHFPQSSSSIQKDYDHFLLQSQEQLDGLMGFLTEKRGSEIESEPFSSGLLSSVDESGLTSSSTVEDYPEKEHFTILPSDSSQDRILLNLRKSNEPGLVIWGPPGTGKSQTIVNIIGDALTRGQRVLLVSQKRAALDVVYDRLASRGVAGLAALVHDAKNDRKPLFEKLSERLLDSSTDRQSNEPIDPSSQIEEVRNRLKEITKALGDDRFGMKLTELYHLGPNKRTDVLLKPQTWWVSLKKSNIGPLSSKLRFLQKVSTSKLGKLKTSRKSFQNLSSNDVVDLKETVSRLLSNSELRSSITVAARIRGSLYAMSDAGANDGLPLQKYESLRNLVITQHKWSDNFSYTFWKNRKSLATICEISAQSTYKAIEDLQKAFGKFFTEATLLEIKENIIDGKLPTVLFDECVEFVEQNFFSLQSLDYELSLITDQERIIVNELEKISENNPNLDWGATLEKSIYLSWIDLLEREHVCLSSVKSGHVEVLRSQFRSLLEKKEIYCAHQLGQRTGKNMQTPEGEREIKGMLGDLKKTRNTLSIRKFIEKHRDSHKFKDLLPVWLASPETVSDVFPAVKGMFDLVIFDEASQCTVQHGLPTIFRGKRIVIAGDEKQLPPSSTFESSTVGLMNLADGDGDGAGFATDEPSLLALAKKNQLYRSFMLEWHYRSKHEELITYSNHAFYLARMKVAPNVVPFAKGNKPAIEWHHVGGFWVDRTNEAEAKKAIELLSHHLGSGSGDTVGIITFNAPQKDLIEDLIDKRSAEDPDFGILIAAETARPIDKRYFVKNIENVQGDERDIIIFSVAYAPSHPGGRVNQLFGSLNMKDGEKRLNVAVTRAIKSVEIVASIDPFTQLDVSTSAHDGPKHLKNYLCFAKSVAAQNFDVVDSLLKEIGPNLSVRGEAKANQFDSPFEEEVFQALTAAGYQIHSQVGQSGFRIDLGIVHPKNPGRYLIGIECDGAMFHSGVSIRERDVFRQKFLEARGWKIHRIWSSSWWENRDREVRKIETMIQSMLSTG
jgi:very-short-patch-repair endonuclease